MQSIQLLENLARHMHDRRRTLGITQEQLAEKSGLSLNYISRLEIADKTPSLATLAMLSKALEVEASELLSGDTKHAWDADAREIARIMDQLNEKDSKFILEQVQAMASHLKSRRKS